VADDRFRFELLARHHDRSAFTSGVEPLDRYLRQLAGQDVRRYVTTVHVMFDTEANLVAGYYTLCAASIEPWSLPPPIAPNLPRYPALPAILLGRLAVDVRYRGQGRGAALLVDALQRCLNVTEEIGAMFVTVDAKDDDARRFYRRFAFEPLIDDDRLVIPMARIERLHGSPAVRWTRLPAARPPCLAEAVTE
jgi:GNAT superfamily N-acetyltransferase